MTCKKTGAHIFLAEYGQYAICDAFQFGSTLLFRIAGTSFVPMKDRQHYTVLQSAQWFDRGRTDGSSTLIAISSVDHGYEGVELAVTE